MKEEFDIKVVNPDGDVIVDEVRKTEQNGFIDLWLPRNATYEVTITQENKKAQAEISTFDDDPTCITTMQLS